MTTNTQPEPTQQFLFGPIIAALVLVGVVAVLVWATQVRPILNPPTEASEAEVASETAQGAGGSNAGVAQTSAGNPDQGQQLFAGTCSACHGPQGKGIPGLGKDMTTSEFIAGLTDDQLVEFLKVGRGAADPLNTTGVAMPPKGGNPSLDDEDLQDIVSYVRTIHQ